MERIVLFITENAYMFFGISLLFTMIALDELALNSPGIHRIVYDMRTTEAGWSMFVLLLITLTVGTYALGTALPGTEPMKLSLLVHFFFCLFFYFGRRMHGKMRYLEKK